MQAKMLSRDILPFVGENILQRLEGLQREVVLRNLASMRANYGNTVDSAINDYQVLLCKQTRDYLYSDAWKVTNYKKGSRPQLEEVAFSIVKDKQTQTEKVLAIMLFTITIKTGV